LSPTSARRPPRRSTARISPSMAAGWRSKRRPSPLTPQPSEGSHMRANGNTVQRKKINIALQGGGSHGAFTWGVLDRLLEDNRLDMVAVSGTSAGAMNAVALADGFVRGGAEGARTKLEDFWRAVARKGRFSPVQRTPWDVLWGNWSIENSP